MIKRLRYLEAMTSRMINDQKSSLPLAFTSRVKAF